MTHEIELEWIERELRALDAASGEILVSSIHADERPPSGVVGLVDWRMSGRIARECIGGFLSGVLGERFLFPGRPRIAFDKVLLVGTGPRAETTESSVRETLATMIDALAGLSVRRATIEVPGRSVVAAPRALEIVNEALSLRPAALETVALIDDRDMQRAVEAWRARPARRK